MECPHGVFQSTLSSRRATQPRCASCGERGFQSTLSSRRATAVSGARPVVPHQISIHALLTESDLIGKATELTLELISIHALLAESDGSLARAFFYFPNFNPRSPHGERLAGLWHLWRCPANFNPRSPHGERPGDVLSPMVAKVFQSTLSSRRATANTTKLALSFLSKVPILGWEKSKKAKGSANARGSFPVYGKNKVRIPWGDFECFRFAPIK